MTEFDVIVIGAGPGGYVAAIRAAQLGFKVACIDNFFRNSQYSLGGTCLNVGCIPSKALLQSSENFFELVNKFKEHGISCDNPRLDVATMLARKEQIIDKNSKGISFLFKKNKITEFHGTASFKNYANQKYLISINDNHNITEISSTHVIVAVGSSSRQLSNVAIDNINIIDNVGALELTTVPQNLCIIGAGVIGVEMGSIWSRLGSKVTILEANNKFMPSADETIAAELLKRLSKQGIDILTGVNIDEIDVQQNTTVKYNSNQSIACDKLMIAIGRIPNTQSINAASVNLNLDKSGFIEVNDQCQTNLPNVWAIGDCVRGPMLAHKASEEGIIVAERIAGQKPHFSFETVPWVIYTNPEVAWVGQTEQNLQKSSIKYNKGVANFAANGRALGLGNSVGMIKILSAQDSDRVLGVHMIGPFVSELIQQAVTAMEFSASAEDIARIIHAHPTLSEVVHEAALACEKRAIHA